MFRCNDALLAWVANSGITSEGRNIMGISKPFRRFADFRFARFEVRRQRPQNARPMSLSLLLSSIQILGASHSTPFAVFSMVDNP